MSSLPDAYRFMGDIINDTIGGIGEMTKMIRDREKDLSSAVSYFGGVLSAAAGGDLSVKLDLEVIPDEYKPIGEDIGSMISATREREQKIKETGEYLQRNAEKIKDAMNKASEGYISVRLERERTKDDVMSEIIDSINLLLENLGKIIDGIKESMQKTVKESEEGSESVSQMNSGMQQISSLAQQIAGGSENLSKIAVSAQRELKASIEIFKALSKASNFSGEKTNEMVKMAEKLSEEAENVGTGMETMTKEIESVILQMDQKDPQRR
ncbi:MAG: hypothetical protein MOIL_00450 [Candidatus Methanolliviera sp. GoM_oil]|nr:MAG: hypothetical protein MOIL_00450 [Candidatus Methanolliviera sp. GoM_oil]